MRALYALILLVLAAIGVGVGVEAGMGTPSSPEHFAERAVGSLDSGHYVQLVAGLNGYFGSTGVLPELPQFELGIDVSDSGSSPLPSASLADLGIDVYLARHANHLADVRIVDGENVYVRANLAAISQLPGLSTSVRSQLGTVAPILGDRWFQLPHRFVASLLTPPSRHQAPKSPAALAESRALVQEIDSAAKKDGTISMTWSPNGQADVSESIRLKPFVTQVLGGILPLIEKSTSQLPRLGIPKLPASAFLSLGGVITTNLYANADTAVLQRVFVDYSNRKTNKAATLTVRHTPMAVVVPSESTRLPNLIINAIERALKPSSLS